MVDVGGTRTGTYTLVVDTLRVSTRPRPTETLASVSAATPSSTRALVIRVYWNASPPAKPTTATTKQRVLTDSQTWFGEVSHGRYTVSGTVTRWLKVSRPDDCYGSIFAVRDQALSRGPAGGLQGEQHARHVMYLLLARRHPRRGHDTGSGRLAVQHGRQTGRDARAGPQPRAAARLVACAASESRNRSRGRRPATSSSTATRSTRWATGCRATTAPTTRAGSAGCRADDRDLHPHGHPRRTKTGPGVKAIRIRAGGRPTGWSTGPAPAPTA